MVTSRFFNIFYVVLIVLATFFFCILNGRKYYYSTSGLFFTILLAFMIGFRDINDVGFGDTALYAKIYQNNLDIFSEEPGFTLFMKISKFLSLPISGFFTVIAFCYIYFQYKGSIGLLRRKSSMLYWFIIGAFSFTGYAYNGIRNGLACSIIYLALPYIFSERKKDWLIAVFIFCIATSIHISTLLPILCIFVVRFVIQSFKHCLYIWFSSIILSLLFGSYFMSFFSGFMGNERLDGYLETMSSHGFRWDFLLYSIIPILLAYYYNFYLRVTDRVYNFLINSYILANALWILVINASFSNRFAYLSWFLYPIVISYPLIKYKSNDYILKQNWAIIAHSAFTVFMWFVYYYR